MILVGELSLWVALLMAAWGATVSFAGGQMRRADLIESGERAIYATLAMVVLASIGLWTALLTHDLSIKYVASFVVFPLTAPLDLCSTREPRTKFLLGGVVVFSTAGYLAASAIEDTGVYIFTGLPSGASTCA